MAPHIWQIDMVPTYQLAVSRRLALRLSARRHRADEPVAKQRDLGNVGGLLRRHDVEAGVARQDEVERHDEAAGRNIGLDQTTAAERDAETLHRRLQGHEALIEIQPASLC